MTTPPPREAPARDCDVVMKGGVTSGVIYPGALVELARTYRFRGLGGASAGAIGAAVGAAAEHGRASGGFEELAAIPGQLADGALGDLFQAQRSTKPLLRLAMAYLRRHSLVAVAVTAVRVFPVASVLGLVPGAALMVVGEHAGVFAGWLLFAVGVLMAVLGVVVAIGLRVYRTATVAVPGNLFGLCRGLGAPEQPGFTDWLSAAIDRCAGVTGTGRPLTFGDLWGAYGDREETPGRDIDLRMVTTCLSLGRPFELPMEARQFFYEPAVWRTLFPAYVMDELDAAAEPVPDPAQRLTGSQWESRLAARNDRPLRRLPEARALPVIVATRLSLSFPGLISAVPLWTIDRTDDASRQALEQFRAAQRERAPYPLSGLAFHQVWFSDGGLCSNFPVHLFDATLPTRPTFAINLDRFPAGRVAVADESQNIQYARDNSQGLEPRYSPLPTSGLAALTGFATLAVDTARNWQDSSHLTFPGYRDRIVQVLQTDLEGGLNLDMDGATIARLSSRGEAAAAAMVGQFDGAHYKAPDASGWDNHRWIRYRALLSCLPDWLAAYADGRALLDIDPDRPPSYDFSTLGGRELAADLALALDEVAGIASAADQRALADLTGAPNPQGMIRRIPKL